MTTSGAAEWSVRGALRRPTCLVLLGVALAARIAYGAWAVFPEKDTLVYDELAVNLFTTHEYRFEGDGGLPYRSPGYPLFLAGVYAVSGLRNHSAVKVVQALLDLASALLVLGIARRLGLTEAVSLAAMGIFLLNPFTVSYSAIVISETLATFLVGLTSWLLLEALARGRPGTLVGLGAAGSAAALTRPIFALLPAALLGYVLVTRRVPLRRWVNWSALALAGFLAVWLPWAIRNVARGTFVPYNVGHIQRPGYNGWAGTWALTLQDVYYGVWESPPRPPARAFRSDAERAEVERLLAEREAIDPAATGAAARLEAIDHRFGELRAHRISADPLGHYVLRPIVRAFAMWFTGNSTFLAQANVPFAQFGSLIWSRPVAVGAKLGGFAWWTLFPLLSIAGWWHLRRRRIVTADLPVLVAVYCTVITCVITVARPSFQVWMEPRYVIESFPGLSPLAAAAGAAVWARLFRSRGTPASPA